MMNSQLLHILSASPEAFGDSLPVLFRSFGYTVIGGEYITNGWLLRLERDRISHVAYCLPTLLAVASPEIDLCARTMYRCGVTQGWVVTRSWFFPGAVERARTLGIKLMDGTQLRQWLS